MISTGYKMVKDTKCADLNLYILYYYIIPTDYAGTGNSRKLAIFDLNYSLAHAALTKGSRVLLDHRN